MKKLLLLLLVLSGSVLVYPGTSIILPNASKKTPGVFDVTTYGAIPFPFNGQSVATATNWPDATAAIIAATTAAADAGGGEVFFPVGQYLVSGPLQTNGLSFSQIPLPYRSAINGNKKIVIKWRSSTPSTMVWANVVGTNDWPQGGALLVSTLTNCAYSSTYGIPAVVGGPNAERVGSTLFMGGSYTTMPWSNLKFVVDGVSIALPVNPTLAGYNLGYVLQLDYRNNSVFAPNIPLTSAYFPLPSNQCGIGLIEPSGNNNAQVAVRDSVFYGLACALILGEHSVHNNIGTFFNQLAYGDTRARQSVHAAMVYYGCVEGCRYTLCNYDPSRSDSLNAISLSAQVIDFQFIDIENYGATVLTALQPFTNQVNIYDPNHSFQGGFTYWAWQNPFSAVGTSRNFASTDLLNLWGLGYLPPSYGQDISDESIRFSQGFKFQINDAAGAHNVLTVHTNTMIVGVPMTCLTDTQPPVQLGSIGGGLSTGTPLTLAFGQSIGTNASGLNPKLILWRNTAGPVYNVAEGVNTQDGTNGEMEITVPSNFTLGWYQKRSYLPEVTTPMMTLTNNVLTVGSITVNNVPSFNGATNVVGTTVVGQLAVTNNGVVYYLDLKR